MTQTAKTLVFINLVLSVVFVAWAVGLVTNQVPWHNPPPGDGPKVEGFVAQLQAQIKKLVEARNSADLRWGEAYVDLTGVEKQRADAQNYYAALLRSVRDGNVADIKPPVQQLDFGPNNTLVLKRNGRPPVTINGENALSLADYHAKIQQALGDIQTAQKQITALVAEMDKLTRQINGVTPTPANATLTQKGLRVQIREQQELVHSLQLEEQALKSPLTYFILQRDQLRQRQAALTARLAELKTAPTAAVRRD
jgi:chromosome segregation ATPase